MHGKLSFSLFAIVFCLCQSLGRAIDSLPNLGLFDIKRPFETIRRRKLRCLLRFLKLDFQLYDFEKYGTYFRDDSVMTLAQAGNYIGADSIEEYVGFTRNETNPFIATGPGPNFDAEAQSIVGLDDDGQCEFLYAYKTNYAMDGTTTTSAARFDLSTLVKIFVDYDEGYISRANVYYDEAYLDFVFNSLLESPQTRDFICDDVINGACNGTIPSIENCQDHIAALPSSEGGYVDENSQGCRALHSAFAIANPENHCAHVALEATEDPNGKLKCQQSYNIQIADLFTEEDLAFFTKFKLDVGIDPAEGYTEIL